MMLSGKRSLPPLVERSTADQCHGTDLTMADTNKNLYDSPEDALEFAEAYPGYPAGLFDAPAEAQADGSTCWQGTDVICFLQLEGESLIVRAPDTATAARVMAAIR